MSNAKNAVKLVTASFSVILGVFLVLLLASWIIFNSVNSSDTSSLVGMILIIPGLLFYYAGPFYGIFALLPFFLSIYFTIDSREVKHKIGFIISGMIQLGLVIYSLNWWISGSKFELL